MIVDRTVIPRERGCFGAADRAFLKKIALQFPAASPVLTTAIEPLRASHNGQDSTDLGDEIVVITDIVRSNRTYRVTRRSDLPLAQLAERLYGRRGAPALVYCAGRAEARGVARALAGLGFPVAYGHGRVGSASGNGSLAAFNSAEADILVLATGSESDIQRPDVDYVAHTAMPQSLASYLHDVQVADCSQSHPECEVFFGTDDFAEPGAGLSGTAGRSPQDTNCTQAKAYCESQACRHLTILNHLRVRYALPGEGEFTCDRCDNCFDTRAACFGDDVGSSVTA